MTHRLAQQKQEKKQSLVDAAYGLFLKNGFHKTSIDDIVKHANVAKGTFYLYFHDKSDVMESIVLRLSCRILREAYDSVKSAGSNDFVENMVAIVDYIIEYFRKNKLVLQLMEKNFSWPLINQKLDGPESESEEENVSMILEDYFENPYLASYSRDEIVKLLYLIIELCGSVSYSSILYEQPDSIDRMKPFLYEVVRKILRP